MIPPHLKKNFIFIFLIKAKKNVLLFLFSSNGIFLRYMENLPFLSFSCLFKETFDGNDEWNLSEGEK